MRDWRTLGTNSPASLGEARLQLHYAVQVVASAGLNMLEARPDDSHPNTEWSDALGGLVGRSVGRGVRAGLSFEGFELVLLDDTDHRLDRFPLDHRKADDAHDWLAEALEGSPRPFARTSYELPEHAIATGAAFARPGADELRELARWYHDAHHAQAEISAREASASEVRCWPHHFDLGLLISLDVGADPETVRSIGVGMSPGDGSYAEPYWYVNPWPAPRPAHWPGLVGGAIWHTEGWTGAVLPATTLCSASSDPALQRDTVQAYLDGAIAACRSLLG